MLRRVTEEVLDELAPDDPRARQSRRDLQRIHRAMRSVSILRGAIARLGMGRSPRRVIELGAGDGTLLLRLGQAIRPAWPATDLTLLDRVDIVSADTLAGYARLGWNVTVLQQDVWRWAEVVDTKKYELGISSLFLHHFDPPQVTLLLAALARKTDSFISCEPRRSVVSWMGSRLIGLLGANEVTRGDAVKSVTAGFAGQELSASWPEPRTDWHIDERPV